MEGLANPALSTGLAALGILLIGFASWLTAVDVSLSRMTLAYAEDLDEEGWRGADSLIAALKTRRELSVAVMPQRDIARALGFFLLTVPLIVQFDHLGMPGWLDLLVTGLIVVLVAFAFMLITASLLSGERYVWVALHGAPIANRLLRRRSRIAALSARNSESVAATETKSSRLDVVEELRELVDEVTEGEPTEFDDDDRELIQSVFELGQTRVGEIMVPRGEIVSLHVDESADEAIDLFLNSGFSRIPIIGKNTDDVLGVLYFKDVVRRLQDTDNREGLHAGDMMRPASFVPEMKLVDDELRVMQQENSHLALVVDEYGGIAGLITVEDIIEELVGDLQDEHDHAAAVPVQVSESVWEVPASFSADDFADMIDVKIDEDDVNSVGGLLAKALGKIPLPGDVAEVGRLTLEAGDEVGRRRQIKTVTVKIASDDDDTDAGGNG